MQCGGCFPDATPSFERSQTRKFLAKLYKQSHCTCPAMRRKRASLSKTQTTAITDFFRPGPVAEVATPRQHCRERNSDRPTTSQALAWLGRSISKKFQHETLNRVSPFHGVIVAIGTPGCYQDNPPLDDAPLPDGYKFLVVYQDGDSETLTGEQVYQHLLPNTFPPVTLLPDQVAAAAAPPPPRPTRPLALSNARTGAACPTQTRLVAQTDTTMMNESRDTSLHPLWVCWDGKQVKVHWMEGFWREAVEGENVGLPLLTLMEGFQLAAPLQTTDSVRAESPPPSSPTPSTSSLLSIPVSPHQSDWDSEWDTAESSRDPAPLSAPSALFAPAWSRRA